MGIGMITDKLLEHSDEFYKKCLGLFPEAYRREYAAPMRQFFREQCRAVQRQNRPVAFMRLWALTLADIGVSAVREHIFEWRQTLMDTKRTEFLVKYHVAELVCGLLAMTASFLSFAFGWTAFWVGTASAVIVATVLATLLDNRWKKDLSKQ
jgi:hypothetical protein